MTQEEKTQIEERIVDVLKTVYDPEIPVDIWNLGMIYKIDVQDDGNVELDMTFTAPSCPAADFILEDVRTKVESVTGVKSANVWSLDLNNTNSPTILYNKVYKA